MNEALAKLREQLASANVGIADPDQQLAFVASRMPKVYIQSWPSYTNNGVDNFYFVLEQAHPQNGQKLYSGMARQDLATHFAQALVLPEAIVSGWQLAHMAAKFGPDERNWKTEGQWLTTQSSIEQERLRLQQVLADAQSALESVRSGQTLTEIRFEAMPSILGTPSSDDLVGTANAEILIGLGGGDIFDGMGGGDILIGGADSDMYVIYAGDVVIEEGGHEGNWDYALATADWVMGDYVEQLDLIGDSAVVGMGNAQDNVISGSAIDNVLGGGAGNDYLFDSYISNDTYLFNRGDAHDVIYDEGGSGDVLRFGSSIASDQLWLSRSGTGLMIRVIGEDDVVTIPDFFYEDRYKAGRIESIEAGDGKVLQASQLANLVQAMAQFSPPPMGQMHLSSDQAAALQPVLAASWQ